MSSMVSQMFLVVKKKKQKSPPANAKDIRDTGSVPGLGRSPRGGPGYPLQYSCLKNPMGRGAWWATVQGVAKSRTQLKRLSMHVYTMSSLSCLPSCIHLNRACALFLMTLYMLGFCLEYPCSSLSLLGNSYLSIRSHIRYSPSRKTSLTPLP